MLQHATWKPHVFVGESSNVVKRQLGTLQVEMSSCGDNNILVAILKPT